MTADIKFEDSKLNKIIKTIVSNYNDFNYCEFKVSINNGVDFETDPDENDCISNEREVEVHLRFSY